MKQPLSTTKRRVRRVCVILLVTVLSYVIASMAGSVIVFNIIFARTSTVNAFELRYRDIDQSKYPRREVFFPSGDNMLYGVVYRPPGTPRALVVAANGMNSCIDRHLPEICYFVDRGFAVMTFENTGVGNSGGATSVGIAQARLDLNAALRYVRGDMSLSGMPLVLYGHSLGGSAVAASLRDNADIRAAVCVSGFNSPNQNMVVSARRRVGVLADMQYPFMCLQNYFLFGGKGDDSAVSAINAVDTPVLIAGGSSDDIVTADISILGRAKDITNPNAVFLEVSEPYRCEHSTVWLSRDAARYLAETDRPTDRQRANQLDEGFMRQVVAFYQKAVSP